jgi:hypothetical protein
MYPVDLMRRQLLKMGFKLFIHAPKFPLTTFAKPIAPVVLTFKRYIALGLLCIVMYGLYLKCGSPPYALCFWVDEFDT